MSVTRIENGNLFDSECKYLVNAVNCQGIMGAGIAKQFADRYPKMYEEYKTLCTCGGYEIGKIRIHEDSGKYIINFPTMRYPGNKSTLINIIKGLQDMKQRMRYEYQYDNVPVSVAMCAVGCGIGGLNAEDVLAEVEKCFKYTNWCNVDFYMPIA